MCQCIDTACELELKQQQQQRVSVFSYGSDIWSMNIWFIWLRCTESPTCSARDAICYHQGFRLYKVLVHLSSSLALICLCVYLCAFKYMHTVYMYVCTYIHVELCVAYCPIASAQSVIDREHTGTHSCICTTRNGGDVCSSWRAQNCHAAHDVF